MDIFRYLGKETLYRYDALRSICAILAASAGSVSRGFKPGRRATLEVLLKQVYFTGFEAVPIVSWIALVLGLVVVTQALSILPRFGGEGMIGGIMVWVVIRELGPVFASVIVVARSGTAIASELASMKVSRELFSLEVMGIDPIHYLVAPRVAGAAVSVLVLTFYFEAVSILGGYLLAGFGKNIAFFAYTKSVLEAMGFLEAGVSLVKSVLFGLIIGSVCSYYGLTVGRSITQIPQKTAKAVMGSLRLVFAADAVLTFIFFS